MFDQWAKRWNVPQAAILELVKLLSVDTDTPANTSSRLEASVQARTRIKAAEDHNLLLWRNQIGAAETADGRFIRFGLANDSKKINKIIKSGDLIGIRRRLISPIDVGSYIGQFVSRECKREDWRYTVNEHNVAQKRWKDLINAMGGDAKFITHEDQL